MEWSWSALGLPRIETDGERETERYRETDGALHAWGLCGHGFPMGVSRFVSQFVVCHVLMMIRQLRCSLCRKIGGRKERGA